MKIANIQLINGDIITVKTKKSFDIKNCNLSFYFLNRNKDFYKLKTLLDNDSYSNGLSNLSIYPFFGAKLLSQQKKDGRTKDIKKIPYFSVQMLII